MSRFDKLLADKEQRDATRRAATGEEHASRRFSQLNRYRKAASVDLADIDRIVSLPIIPEITEEEAEEVSRRWLLAPAFKSGRRLLSTQAEGINAFEHFGAGFFKLGVGWGKTGLSLLCAEHAYRNGADRLVLFVPSSVYPQLVKQDIKYWRKMFSLSVPIHRLGNQTPKMRRRIVDAQRKGLYIMPFSLLSRPDSLHMLRSIDPDLIIADEAHGFKNRSSGRSKKLFGWKEERISEDREVPNLVAMSGTMTSKHIADYHHLITWSLADGSPLPMSASLAKQWGSVIDSGSIIDGDHQTGPLTQLVDWARTNFPDEVFKPTVSDFRRAYKLRLITAPGVVSTGDQEIGTSLTITTLGSDSSDAELVALVNKIKEENRTPNGDVIEHAMQEYKWLSELTAGFYNELLWPTAERLASRTWTIKEKEITFTEKSAEDALKLAMEHHERHQVYSKELREYLKDAPLGQDTPMEVARLINQHPEEMPGDLVMLYENMKACETESVEQFGTLVQRESHVHRVDDFKIRTSVEWAQCLVDAGEGGILWFWHNGIGQWLRDSLHAAGVDVLYCPAGKDANETIIDHAHSERVVVASIAAHGIGKNLQHFQHQLFVQWPRVATTAEQTLGRTHRTGQEADELVVYRFDTTSFDTLNFAACLNDSVYSHQSTGDRQKIVYANYDPLPTVFSPEFLREQGASPDILTMEQRDMMEEIFGDDWRDSF